MHYKPYYAIRLRRHVGLRVIITFTSNFSCNSTE
jgi:hypothetical protein